MFISQTLDNMRTALLEIQKLIERNDPDAESEFCGEIHDMAGDMIEDIKAMQNTIKQLKKEVDDRL